MNKIRLVLQPDEFVSAVTPHLEHIFVGFDVVFYDPHTTYNKRDIFLFKANLEYKTNYDLSRQLSQEGFKVVLEQLHDSNKNLDYPAVSITLRHVDWFWVNEYYVNLMLGYMDYTPSRTYKYKSLMAAFNRNQVRDKIFELFSDELPNMIYGYNKNPSLPFDNENFNMWDRYFNPYWYDNTCFTTVLETRVVDAIVDDFLFITEKSYKPFAFKHPFISISQPGAVSHLKDIGFVTYDNLFDETYLNFDNLKERIHNVYTQVKQFVIKPYDSLTLEKIDHNYNLFYNKQRVDQIVNEAIINPIMEYAET